MQPKINNIAIVGGTHGNELSGVTLLSESVQKSLRNPYLDLNIQFVTGNPKAVAANVRFTEDDLNRQFTLDNLAAIPTSYEASRAHELNASLGPKTAPQLDVLIDIHNTTSNMGATLIILDTDIFHLGMARYVKEKMPEAVVLIEDEKTRIEHPYLCTLAKNGVMVEVGGQPQGVCRADVYAQAYKMTRLILDYCQWANTAEKADILSLQSVEAFRLGDVISFPVDDNGQRMAMIHPQLQDNDFMPLRAGDPVFLYLDNSVSLWQGRTTYPHFINEAAYHNANIAFATSDKTEL